MNVVKIFGGVGNQLFQYALYRKIKKQEECYVDLGWFEDENKNSLLSSPGMYGLSQQHKHLKEMMKLCQLENAPVFCPTVAPYYSGMEVTVPLFKSSIKGSIDDIKAVYKSVYTGSIVKYVDSADEGGFMSAAAMSGKDGMQVTLCGNEDRILLISRFDNLGFFWNSITFM